MNQFERLGVVALITMVASGGPAPGEDRQSTKPDAAHLITTYEVAGVRWGVRISDTRDTSRGTISFLGSKGRVDVGGKTVMNLSLKPIRYVVRTTDLDAPTPNDTGDDSVIRAIDVIDPAYKTAQGICVGLSAKEAIQLGGPGFIIRRHEGLDQLHFTSTSLNAIRCVLEAPDGTPAEYPPSRSDDGPKETQTYDPQAKVRAIRLGSTEDE